MSRERISLFIVCFNEERNIRRCLESVKWCDELVVVDAGSTDKTLEICREYNCRIEHRAWNGYVEQKRYGLSLCSSPWVLNLDADEEVSAELAAEIQQILSEPSSLDGLDGFYLSRVVFFLGKWWRKGGWYPEYRLRICRKANTEWAGVDPHEKATVKGQTKRLRGELLHYTYMDLADQINRLNRHSTAAAKSMLLKGERASIVNMLLNPASRFLKFYFLKKGFLEGFPGLIVAYNEAYYAFLKYVKLWELQRRNTAVLPES